MGASWQSRRSAGFIIGTNARRPDLILPPSPPTSPTRLSPKPPTIATRTGTATVDDRSQFRNTTSAAPVNRTAHFIQAGRQPGFDEIEFWVGTGSERGLFHRRTWQLLLAAHSAIGRYP